MIRALRAALCWAPLCVLGCDSARPHTGKPQANAVVPQTAPPVAAVRWFGALHAIMHEGRSESQVLLRELVPGPHTFGVGALAGLAGEVTIADDEVWLARPTESGSPTITRADLRGSDREQGAALLVVANVRRWHELSIDKPVAWAELDAYLAAQLRAHHVPVTSPVALRIEGPMAELAWHVVDGSKLRKGAGHAEHARTAVSGVLSETMGRLIGFYSQDHEGVFTHRGSHSHFHVLVSDPLVSGHVDRVDIVPGARLSIGM